MFKIREEKDCIKKKSCFFFGCFHGEKKTIFSSPLKKMLKEYSWERIQKYAWKKFLNTIVNRMPKDGYICVMIARYALCCCYVFFPIPSFSCQRNNFSETFCCERYEETDKKIFSLWQWRTFWCYMTDNVVYNVVMMYVVVGSLKKYFYLYFILH